MQNYHPLPQRLRTRTSSRPSPYPQQSVRGRKSSVTASPIQQRSVVLSAVSSSPPSMALHEISISNNILMSPLPNLDTPKVFSPIANKNASVKKDALNQIGLPKPRPRVGSNARRNNLGWAKRSNGGKHSTDQKENNSSMVMMTSVNTFHLCNEYLNLPHSPGESLRINRPRPRAGRATPARSNLGAATTPAARQLRV